MGIITIQADNEAEWSVLHLIQSDKRRGRVVIVILDPLKIGVKNFSISAPALGRNAHPYMSRIKKLFI